jgi:hypothetical protein
MPYGLDHVGLGAEMSIVWTPTFNGAGTEDAALTFDVLSQEQSKSLNRRLLETSRLGVVLVCGQRVERCLQDLDLKMLSRAQKFSLNRFETRADVQESDVATIRIFLVCPAP